MAKDDDRDSDPLNDALMKAIIEAFLKAMTGGLSGGNGIGISLGDVLSPGEPIKIPYYEITSNNKKYTALVDMPGASEEDISIKILEEDYTRYLVVSTMDSVGEKYRLVVELPQNIKKAVKQHFTNGVLEISLN